jgi:hypothetical protein
MERRRVLVNERGLAVRAAEDVGARSFVYDFAELDARA